MRENGTITKLMALALTCGQTVGSTMVSGSTMTCKEWEFISTLTEFDMTDSTKTTKRRDLDNTSGLTAESMKVGGIWVNSTA